MIGIALQAEPVIYIVVNQDEILLLQWLMTVSVSDVEREGEEDKKEKKLEFRRIKINLGIDT